MIATQLLREAKRLSGDGPEDTVGSWSAESVASASFGRIQAWALFVEERRPTRTPGSTKLPSLGQDHLSECHHAGIPAPRHPGRERGRFHFSRHSSQLPRAIAGRGGAVDPV